MTLDDATVATFLKQLQEMHDEARAERVEMIATIVRFEQKIDDVSTTVRRCETKLKRLRGTVEAVRGEVSGVGAKVESMGGDIIVLSANYEALEENAQASFLRFERLDQSLDGMTQLAKSAYDLNASTLSKIAKQSPAHGQESDNAESRTTLPGVG